MDRLVAYAVALENEKNEKFGLAGKVEQIISQTNQFETEIPNNVAQNLRKIESLTENMISDVTPINQARVEFANLFNKTTQSNSMLTPNGTIY